MTRRLIAVLLALLMAAAACGDDDAGGGGAVSIDSPAGGTQVAAGTSLTVQVTAADDAGVSRIDLQYGGQTVLSITNTSGSNPFVAVQSWVPTEPGSSNLVAVAYRADGSVVGSTQVPLTVAGDPVSTTTSPDGSDTSDGSTDTTAGGTDTTAGGTGTTAGGTGTTAGTTTSSTAGSTTSSTAGSTTSSTTGSTTSSTAGTTTTAGAQVAPDDGGDGRAPTEHELYVEAKNTGAQTAIFEGEISNPGDRGDGIEIIVTNLFNSPNGSKATVTVQFICDPGGPRVRTAGTGGYTGGSACDFTYTTTFEATYQNYKKNYYIFVPDGVEGYFEYTLLVTAKRY